MENRQLKVRLYSDGRIDVKTQGVKGKTCMKYMEILEEMMRASVIDSEFTEEFYESEIEEQINQVDVEVKQNGDF